MSGDISAIKRVLILGSAVKIRRGLASALNYCLDKPSFTAIDASSQGLPDSQFGWKNIDLMVVDISRDKSRICSWFYNFPDRSDLPPAIFTDQYATVDDAGDLYRAGVADYLELHGIKRKRLMRALGYAAEALQERRAAALPVPPVPEEKTELLETVSPEDIPAEIDVADASTEVLSQVKLPEPNNQSTGERAEFINTGLLSILERDKVKKSEVIADLKSEPRSDESWPFTYRDIEEGIAVFNGYRLLEYLGSGGTASVFKVARESDEQIFAMKLFDAETPDRRGKDRFMRGYQLLEGMVHPHIGKIEDLIDTGVHVAAILEYFPSGDLQARIGGHGHIPRDKAIYYATQIAAALNSAQEHGVLHRDLKPSNIMFRQDSDSLALIDFGIAKSVDQDKAHHLTMEGQLVGTPYYTSPEQALGKSVDHRSDLYALGVILFEMLEGKRPFDGGSAIEIMTAHVRGDIPQLSDTDEALKGIVNRLLAKSPEDRFSSGLEVEHALQAILPDDQLKVS